MKRTVFLVLMNFLAQAISGIALNAQSCGTFAQIVYVNSDAQGANNGTSWANAFTKLQDALAIACSCSQVNQVWVAAGTYYPDEGNGQSNNNRSSSFYMCNQVAIYGGFAGTETDINQRDWQQHVTMLSGDIDQVVGDGGNAYHVVRAYNTNATAVLDGLTVRDGNCNGPDPDNRGAGIEVKTGSATIRNCVITANVGSLSAGMHNQSANTEVSNCLFSFNYASVVTSGVNNRFGANAVFRNCSFISNSAGIEFGLITNESSHPKFINCVFSGNQAVAGNAGVVFNASSHPEFINCLFSGNRAGANGGVFFNHESSNPKLINCTFSGNKAVGQGGAIYNQVNSHPILINCIIWNNEANSSTTSTSASIYNIANGTATISYSLIANSGGSSNWNSNIGNNGGNNIATDPLFIQPFNPSSAPTTSGNYRFTASSPARNAGNLIVNLGEPLDLDGNLRLAGCIDMGPYEFVEPPAPCPGFNPVSLEFIHPCLSAGEDSLKFYPTWKDDVEIKGYFENGTVVILPNEAVTWSSSHPNRATATNGRIHALSPGVATISVTLNNFTGTLPIRVIAPVLQPEIEVVPITMSQPDDECSVMDMPVLIIRYIPTADGVNLDLAYAADFWSLNPQTVAQVEQTLWAYDERVRFALEEGSRFRDYGTHTKGSYMGYRVVDIITVFEPLPRGKVAYFDVNGYPCFFNDHFTIFERFNVEDYVNNYGVKEVWLWTHSYDSNYPSYNPSIHTPCNFRFIAESNMSSPLTGDISNSNQDPTDLPVYDRTYIVYGQNMRRSQAEVLHNHGHQIERMIPYVNYLQDVNTDLFWKKFVGQNSNNEFITGRCGWTHMPPNTTGNYDYENTTLVFSDIKNWTPAGGAQQQVNVNTWANMNYSWPGASSFPQKTESQWYIMWFQSIPGNNNTIPYNGQYITNWWNIIGDWDKAITSGMGLYAPSPTGLATKNEVVKNGNTGYGSLRSVIGCAASGSTVTISPELDSQNLTLLSPISINKIITLEGSTAPDAWINASASTWAFQVQNTGTLNLRSLQIACGTSTSQSGLLNSGNVTLHNMKFSTGTNFPVIRNNGLLQVTSQAIMVKN